MSGYLFHCPTRNELSFVRLNQNDNIITIDDEVPTDFPSIRGSILLPPASLMFNYVDTGDRISFGNAYYEYLSSDVPDRMLTMIWIKLLRGNNIVLFNNTSDSEMFLPELSHYMSHVFGMYLCSVYEPFMALNTSMVLNILYKAYSYNYIANEEYNYYVGMVQQQTNQCSGVYVPGRQVQPTPELPQSNSTSENPMPKVQIKALDIKEIIRNRRGGKK